MAHNNQQTPVILLYGGPSTEHEVSCRSAAFVVENIDCDKYNLTAFGIAKDGSCHQQPVEAYRTAGHSVLPLQTTEDSQGLASLVTHLHSLKGQAPVVFPMLHGTGGEDGRLQGFLDLCQVAYVGPDTLSSAIAMDKILTKTLAQQAGIPVVPYVWCRRHEWAQEPERWLDRIQTVLQGPYFVKPASLGSSVGITKAQDHAMLPEAISYAFKYDDKVLIESAVEGREIEFAALGGYEPEISTAGECISHAEFYSYSAKYDATSPAEVKIPAELEQTELLEGQSLAKKTFQELHLYGMARIDLFLSTDGKFFLNEVNTIPGFTSISQYPLLWKHSGISASALISKLIELAQDRHHKLSQLQRSVT